jgi:transposase IS200 family protein
MVFSSDVEKLITIRQANLPEVQRMLWGPHFWSPSYCVVSCGGAPLEVVKRYIQEQAGDGTQNSCGIPDEELVALLESTNTEGSGSSPP